jgi:hypothetical protein
LSLSHERHDEIDVVPLVDALMRASRKSYFAALVALGAVIAGLLGSVYSKEISTSFPLKYLCSYHALVFWLVLVATTAALAVRQESVDRAQKGAEAELHRRTDELVNLIRTMPPADFLGSFRELFGQAFLAYEAGQDSPDVADEAIRQVLRCIAILSHQFDRRPKEKYCANVMLFLPSKDVTEDVRKRLLFEPTLALSAMRGVLDLQTSLSTTADSTDAAPDPSLVPIALAVPKEPQIIAGPSTLWKVLPGAPLAFVTKRVDAYKDTTDLRRWCDEKGDFTEETKQLVEKYFSQGRGGRSFVSLPLSSPDDSSDPIGVLNLHRNSPGMLHQDNAVIEQFALLAHPFVAMLFRLLQRGRGSEE